MAHFSELIRTTVTFFSVFPFALVLISLHGETQVEGAYWGSSGPEDPDCRDVHRRCSVYKLNKQCENKRLEKWIKRKCARTCGFCVPRKPECQHSQYGCCEDRVTPADGPNGKGCSIKLCVDQVVCDKMKKACESKSKYVKNYMAEKCAATCGLCRAPASPMQKCEEQNPAHSCCWNGDAATGPGKKGCPACVDTSRYVCKLFQDKCESKFYIEQNFMEKHCPRTCGRCPNDCFDTKDKCSQWALEGMCRRQFWKHFMKKHCSQSCGHCRGAAVKH